MYFLLFVTDQWFSDHFGQSIYVLCGSWIWKAENSVEYCQAEKAVRPHFWNFEAEFLNFEAEFLDVCWVGVKKLWNNSVESWFYFGHSERV